TWSPPRIGRRRLQIRCSAIWAAEFRKWPWGACRSTILTSLPARCATSWPTSACPARFVRMPWPTGPTRWPATSRRKPTACYKSIAIQALTQAQGGISASIGTSTYMNSQVATEFMNQLLTNATTPGARWGNALVKAQQWAAQQGGGFYGDFVTTEQIFGDPAM